MKNKKIISIIIKIVFVVIILVVIHPIALFLYDKGCNYDVSFIDVLLSKETWDIFPMMSIAYVVTFFLVVLFAKHDHGRTEVQKAERERNLAASKYATASAQYRSSLKTGNASAVRSAANRRDEALANLISKK